jgi:hypothetical protein
MSEITVTLPKDKYDHMVKRIDEYKELHALVEARVYFTEHLNYNDKTSTRTVYYKPTEPGEIESSLKQMFDEKEIEMSRKANQYLTDVAMLKTIIEHKNGVILELNDRIKEYETSKKVILSKPNMIKENGGSVNKPWWKLF